MSDSISVQVIAQRKKNDCLVCCCAMYFDLSYEQTIDYVKKCSEYYELYVKDSALPISLARRISLMQRKLENNWVRPYRFDSSKRSILAVVGSTSLHCVYWDKKIYDPGDTGLTDIKYVFQRIF
jgi:hypothetical protein